MHAVLVLAHERLLREIVAALAHREHRALFPLGGLLVLGVHLVVQALLIRDRGGHLLLRRASCVRMSTRI